MMRSCAVIVLTIVFGGGALGAQSSKPSTPVAIAEAFFRSVGWSTAAVA